MNKREWNEAVTDRVERLLGDMGWTPNDLAKAIFQSVGATSRKAVVQYFDDSRRSIPAYSLDVIARFLEVDLDYIMLRSDDLDRAVAPNGRYAMATRIRKLERAAG